MSIFAKVEVEDTVQVGDKTRISAIKSFAAKGELPIAKVEIKPSEDDSFIDVTGTSSEDWFLDWVYTTDGEKTVTVRLTLDEVPAPPSPGPGPAPAPTPGEEGDVTATINVVSAEDDALFSNDQMLTALEPDILKWVPAGRSSFLNVHRQTQKDILAWLDEKGFTDTDGNRLTKAAIVDIEEVRAWSTAHTLRLIFNGISNQVGDIFQEKMRYYESLAINHRNRSQLRLDINGDGNIDKREGVNMKTMGISRR